MDYNELSLKMEKTKSKMTPSERMEKYFAGEMVDHLPYSLLLGDEVLCEMYGYKTSEMDADFDVYTEIVERKIKDFDMNHVSIGLGLRTLGAAMGSTPFRPEHGIERLDRHILQDYSDWSSMDDADPYDNKILTPLLEKAAKIKERFPDIVLSTGVVGPLSTAVAIRPIEKALKDTRQNPEKLKELIKLSVDKSLKWVEIFAKEFNIKSASVSDPVTCTDILGRKQFEEFSFPELKRLVSGVKEIVGAKPSLHICGHTKGIWRDLRELEISSFSIDNCEDIAEAREILGDTIPIMGNIPPVDVLRYGSIDDVIESVKDCIRKGATSPKGYIVASGCGIPMGTPKENLDAFIYAVQTYGKDAKIGELPLGMNTSL